LTWVVSVPIDLSLFYFGCWSVVGGREGEERYGGRGGQSGRREGAGSMERRAERGREGKGGEDERRASQEAVFASRGVWFIFGRGGAPFPFSSARPPWLLGGFGLPVNRARGVRYPGSCFLVSLSSRFYVALKIYSLTYSKICLLIKSLFTKFCEHTSYFINNSISIANKRLSTY